MKWFWAFALGAGCLVGSNGCALERNGRTRHVIIGFGVVSVPSTNSVAETTRITALGAWLAPGQATVGYVSALQTKVQASATNTVIEIKK